MKTLGQYQHSLPFMTKRIKKLISGGFYLCYTMLLCNFVTNLMFVESPDRIPLSLFLYVTAWMLGWVLILV